MRRQKAPRFQLIVLNRIPSAEGAPGYRIGSSFVFIVYVSGEASLPAFHVCADQLKEDILDDFEFELSPPYLLYRNKNEVNGAICTSPPAPRGDPARKRSRPRLRLSRMRTRPAQRRQQRSPRALSHLCAD